MAGKKMYNRAKDVRVFKKSSAQTKRINRSQGAQQGGIRF